MSDYANIVFALINPIFWGFAFVIFAQWIMMALRDFLEWLLGGL